MKIAVSCTAPTGGSEDWKNAKVDPRFGRAQGFLVYDDQTDEAEYVDNAQNLSLPQGAGIQAAQNVAATGAQVVLTGHVGPKAYLALDKGGIAICLGVDGNVGEAVRAYKAGELESAQGPDKDGHW